ncbi:MAG: hydroxyethylthiazole kinase [Rhizobiales bacterium 65-9]|nr:hydroxyethylthiazole kinase [Hyphomicrobiales bacterium]OJY33264.1 MAG: hydroxyethylthiazole kinase [Rhizobiales bacterium 65-9]
MVDIAPVLDALRAQRPLVQNITNFVVMNFSANALLAMGASPAMVHAVDEVEDFVAISASLVVNIGTLDAGWAQSMRLAAAKADALGKPWVLDPVGVGATRFRQQTCADLMRHRPSIIRGNAAEIMTLAGAQGGRSRGVDSLANSADAIDAAQHLARATGCVAVASGEADIVTDGERVATIRGGAEMITLITGTGCSLSAATAAMAAVAPDRFVAAVAACALFKVAAERAAAKAGAPGTLAARFLDALYGVDAGDLAFAASIELA